MPELPEVETITRQLRKKIINKKIININILKDKNFKGDYLKAINQKIVDVQRQAKIIVIKLSNNLNLIIHLKMTGQLIYRKILNTNNPYDYKPKKNVYDLKILPNKYTRVIIKFSDNTYLLFNNLRTFGWIKIVSNKKLPTELKNFSGINPLSRKFTKDFLTKITNKTKKPIKLLLLDQKKIAGIGNIYASEILFCANIHPQTPTKNLKTKRIAQLHTCIIKILKNALKHKGTTDKDEAFRDTEGNRGSMQNYLKVYGREGKQCLNCNAKIKRTKISGRSTYFCPNCQSQSSPYLQRHAERR